MRDVKHAKRMLLMAAKDMKALQIFLKDDSVDIEIFGFHAQQVVEKIFCYI